MPARPTAHPQRVIPAGLNGMYRIIQPYALARVAANQLYNDQVRRYNAAVWNIPMDRRHVFRLPVDAWSARIPVAGLPKKMRVIRQVQPAQWVAWAGPLNLDIRATDTVQEMIDRYLLWLGLPPGSNQLRRA
jgi:hypothetical protein